MGDAGLFSGFKVERSGQKAQAVGKQRCTLRGRYSSVVKGLLLPSFIVRCHQVEAQPSPRPDGSGASTLARGAPSLHLAPRRLSPGHPQQSAGQDGGPGRPTREQLALEPLGSNQFSEREASWAPALTGVVLSHRSSDSSRHVSVADGLSACE